MTAKKIGDKFAEYTSIKTIDTTHTTLADESRRVKRTSAEANDCALCAKKEQCVKAVIS